MRTVIAGSRGLTDPRLVAHAMASCGWAPTAVLCGEASGPDTLGAAWARERGIPVESYPADWAGQGRSAGYLRNTLMASRCDAVVAVWDNQSRGTLHMIDEAVRYSRRLFVHHTGYPTVPAGLTRATILPDMDFETYSPAGYAWDDETGRWAGLEGAEKKRGLEVSGTARYVLEAGFDVLTLAYDLKDGMPVREWHPGMPPPRDLLQYLLRGGLIEAWNNTFERWVWEQFCVPVLHWPAIRVWQWRCAMAKARAHSLPGALAEAGAVVGALTLKDAEGTRLLDKFSKPRQPTQGDPRLRRVPIWTPEAAQAEVARRVAANPRATTAAMRKIQATVEAEAADSRALMRYCATDVASESEVSRVTPDMSAMELQFWRDDQTINRRGIQLDMEGVEDCIAILRQAHTRYGAEIESLTGGIKATEVQQLLGWLHGRGVHLDALDEDAVTLALGGPLPDDARRALQIRAAVASASVRKVFAMRNQATPEGRLHNLYMFHAAHTGRPTSVGAQAANLPKAGPAVVKCPKCGRWHGAHTMWCWWCATFTLHGPKAGKEWNPDAMADARRAISYRSLDYLESLFGDALSAVAGTLRGLFIAAPGHDLISSDFSAIEGVVIAALAGEKWRLDVFAGHGKIYEMSAAKILGIRFEDMMAHAGYHDLTTPEWWKAKQTGPHHPARQKPGKIAELGLGFGGWINAWRQFGGSGTDDEIKENIVAWRAASPNIEWLWGGQKKGPADNIRQNAGMMRGADRWDRTPEYFGLEGMAVSSVLNPGMVYPVLRLDGTDSGIAYMTHQDVLYCRAPSGGLITYHRPRLVPADQEWRGLSLSYEGWNTNPKNGPKGWIRKQLYSGRAAENVTQKVARDKQMLAISRCERNAYPVVMHTYDEIVSEVPQGSGSVEGLEALMGTEDAWNVGWPIKAAGGWRAPSYRKG